MLSKVYLEHVYTPDRLAGLTMDHHDQTPVKGGEKTNIYPQDRQKP